ncbi:MAG: flavin reductase family protein [Chloroflexi bacterium]|nr:MAG: flavin reductase family protein [Chloroflexota bacterium]RLC75540.1 MAG: flavin reductase family protein [Chloroflexota bacterium]HEY73354.1 flavin reductase family protein [Thermoflexia bacterium]
MAKVTKKPTTALYPVPAVMVSCGVGERANIITLAWVGTLCSKPPLVGIGVRPSRHSHGLIKEFGEFVINLPSAEQARWLDYCGIVSGRDEDKWAACGFTPAPAAKVQTPLIAECLVNIECRLQQTLSLGSHDLFIGEVAAVQMDEAVLDERGRLDFDKARPFAYSSGEYRRIGELLGTFGYSKKK